MLLGTDEDIAFVAEQLPRFLASIDGDFAEAVARIGAPRATALYLKHVAPSRDPVPAVHLALWRRPAQVTPMASRFLGAGDERAFGALLNAVAEAGLAIDAGVLASALSAKSQKIVEDTIWHLAERYALDPTQFPATLRAVATADREDAPISEAFGREIRRRILGAKRVERPEWLAWLRTDAGRSRVPDRSPAATVSGSAWSRHPSIARGACRRSI